MAKTKILKMKNETIEDFKNLKDEKTIKLLIEKTFKMKDVDILTIYGIYHNFTEDFINLRQLIPQRLCRSDGIILDNEFTSYILPKPEQKMYYKDENDNWQPLNTQTPKNIRIAIAKGDIKPGVITIYDKLDVYYDIDDCKLTETEKEKYTILSPFEKLDANKKYKILVNFMEKSLGIIISEENLNTFNLNGYYDNEKNRCVINSNFTPVKKVKVLLAQLSEIVIDKTTTQPIDMQNNEKILLKSALYSISGYKSDLSELNVDLLLQNGILSSVVRTKKACSNILDMLYNSYDLTRFISKQQNETKTQENAKIVAQNFMEDL